MGSTNIGGTINPINVISTADFQHDIEMIAEPIQLVDVTSIVSAGAGNTVLLTPTAGKKLLIASLSFSSDTGFAGLIDFKIASTEIAGIHGINAKSPLEETFGERGYLGSTNGALSVDLPAGSSGATLRFYVYYSEEL